MDSILSVESTNEELLQRVKDTEALGLHIEANTEELLQRFKGEEAIREYHLMQWECLVLMTE